MKVQSLGQRFRWKVPDSLPIFLKICKIPLKLIVGKSLFTKNQMLQQNAGLWQADMATAYTELP